MNTYMKSYMKKLKLVVVAVAIMATALVGCGDTVKQTNESLTILISQKTPIQDSMIAEYKNKFPEITVNVLEKPEDLGYDEFYKKVCTELMTGNGPDIISLDNRMWSLLDGDKAMRIGLFENLNPYIEQDKDFNKDLYYDFVLDSGKLNENQYVIPIYYDVPMLVTGEEMAKKVDIKIDNMNTVDGLRNEINSFYQKNIADISFVDDSYFDEDILLYSVGKLVDYDSQSILLDKNKLMPIAEVARKTYSDSHSDVFKLVVENTTTMEYSRDFNAVACRSEMISVHQPVEFVPIRNEQGNIVSKVNSAVAINRSSKNKSNAYEFIRVMLDSLEVETTYDNPTNPKNNVISKKGMEFIYSSVTRDDPLRKVTITFNNYVKEYTATALGDREIDAYNNIIDEISTCELFSSKAYGILYDELIPYLKDEKSYEECIQSAQNKLEIYISE